MLPPKPSDLQAHPVSGRTGETARIDPNLLRPGPLFRPDRPEPDPTWRTRRDRLTPFLVLRTGPSDMGQTGIRRISMDSPTLRLVRVDTGAPSGFELKHGVTYSITGQVTNLGQGTALMGIATLRIMNGTELTKLWGKPDPTFFDVIDFKTAPGSFSQLRFRRTWTAPVVGGGLDGRVSVILHVVDLLGDNNDFVVDGQGDRRAIRQDYHLT